MDNYGPGSRIWELMEEVENRFDELSDEYPLADLWHWVAECAQQNALDHAAEARKALKNHDS